MADLSKSAQVGGISSSRFDQICNGRFEQICTGGGYFWADIEQICSSRFEQIYKGGVRGISASRFELYNF